LADLRLIRGIGCIELRTGSQGRNNRRDKMRIGPSPKETTIDRRLKSLEAAKEIRFRERLRKI
jgi:hypothetical protein